MTKQWNAISDDASEVDYFFSVKWLLYNLENEIKEMRKSSIVG